MFGHFITSTRFPELGHSTRREKVIDSLRLTCFDAIWPTEMSIVETNIPPTSSEDDTQLRDLFLFTIGNRTFGVPADEVEGTVEGKQPAPLPHSPAPILGIVYARGRMLTVVDPLSLTNDESPKLLVVPQVISLRGDEHLALAAETVLPTITVSTGDIENTSDTDESEG